LSADQRLERIFAAFEAVAVILTKIEASLPPAFRDLRSALLCFFLSARFSCVFADLEQIGFWRLINFQIN